jgi:hypothetical protein
MAVTTGILAVAGGALAVEAFAADVADGEVGVDFFSAAGLRFGAAGAGFEVVVVEARSQAVSAARSFPALATWKRLAAHQFLRWWP